MHKRPFARDNAPLADLAEIVDTIKPHILIGVSGQTGAFNETVVRNMANHNDRPIIFALSNPTSKAECTAEQAYTWTEGSAVFASGSPFDPFELNGITHISGQGNNAYIFPGIGLGAIVAGAKRITDSMFHVAANTLAEMTPQAALDQGSVFPALADLRKTSIKIGIAVAGECFRRDLASIPEPVDLSKAVNDYIWLPEY